MKIFGANAVTEALHAGRVKALSISNKRDVVFIELSSIGIHRVTLFTKYANG